MQLTPCLGHLLLVADESGHGAPSDGSLANVWTHSVKPVVTLSAAAASRDEAIRLASKERACAPARAECVTSTLFQHREHVPVPVSLPVTERSN
eukprot:scaffold14958_cov79-Phaeocystis_antarctica.AAC.1